MFAARDGLAVGQRWLFGPAESSLVIGKIDSKWPRPDICHISIDGPTTIGHMPIARKSLAASVTAKLDDNVALPDGFGQGYATWKAHRGGVFEMSVAEAVKAVAGMMPSDDEFDGLVRQMREERTQAGIDRLYDRLFSLPTWFFLSPPDDPRKPVTWVFEQGRNPAPCILAFTSQEQATRGVGEIGMQGAGVIPAPRAEAAAWLLGPLSENDGLTWACFNLGGENFPVYFDEIRRRKPV